MPDKKHSDIKPKLAFTYTETTIQRNRDVASENTLKSGYTTGGIIISGR